MCMAAPGPRCANHLKQALNRNKKRIKEALANDDTDAFNAADAERASLQFEYAGTRSGQNAIEDQISKTEDGHEINELIDLQMRARESYKNKVEQFQTLQNLTDRTKSSKSTEIIRQEKLDAWNAGYDDGYSDGLEEDHRPTLVGEIDPSVDPSIKRILVGALGETPEVLDPYTNSVYVSTTDSTNLQEEAWRKGYEEGRVDGGMTDNSPTLVGEIGSPGYYGQTRNPYVQKPVAKKTEAKKSAKKVAKKAAAPVSSSSYSSKSGRGFKGSTYQSSAPVAVKKTTKKAPAKKTSVKKAATKKTTSSYSYSGKGWHNKY